MKVYRGWNAQGDTHCFIDISVNILITVILCETLYHVRQIILCFMDYSPVVPGVGNIHSYRVTGKPFLTEF